jgi:hypothetical protein
MTLLSDIKAIVTQVLGNPEIGRPVTIRRVTSSTSDPVAGTVSKVTEDIAANSYFDKFTKYNTPEGWNVENNDALAYLDQAVDTEDQVLRESITWSVLNVDPVELGDGIAIWIAQLRR